MIACALQIGRWCFSVSDMGTWLGALVTTSALVYSMYWNRRLAKASVEPTIEVTSMTLDLNYSGKRTSLNLANYGIGPAKQVRLAFVGCDKQPQQVVYRLGIIPQWTAPSAAEYISLHPSVVRHEVNWPDMAAANGRIRVDYLTVAGEQRTLAKVFSLSSDGYSYVLEDLP